jgi:tRNA A-37 threonylcarbamoyl transferase component Bud32
VKSFAFDDWDGGRLTVNREFAPLLARHELTTFVAIANYSGGQVAKNVLRERNTTRLELVDAGGATCTLYLKRHQRPRVTELIKPLFRLTRPIVGARNEWEAILRFHEIGIATMVPVALGEADGRSFLMTQGIEDCQKLTAWMESHRHSPRNSLRNGDPGNCELAALRNIVTDLADVARRMHAAGMHHQDFYLTHLMVPQSGRTGAIHVLDLGRARFQPRLARRWIVKDLGQLNYSADGVSASDRLRFFKRYLGRNFISEDRALARRILSKSRAIARHSRKNGL